MIVPTAVIDDLDLEKLLQVAVVGITGLPGDLVRPRYQVVTPRQPEASVTWCAIGDVTDTADSSPWMEGIDTNPGNPPDPGDLGALAFWDHEQIDFLASFYGPKGKSLAKFLRDGIKVPQNMEGLSVNLISLVEVGPIRRVPEYINQQWIQRFDFTLSFNRKIERVYPIERFKQADVHLFDDTFFDTIIPVPPES